mgnify:CR=1 FL=1
MRINKYIALCGVASRRKSEELITSGCIRVNGKVVTNLATDIKNNDKVTYNGNLISLPNNFVYYKFYKPKGYICSASDEKGRKTIFDIVKVPERVFSVGRLDFNSEGLLILTNDGYFALKLTHPSQHVEKEYTVTVEGEIKESELAVLRKGVVENGIRMPEAKVKLVECKDKLTKLTVRIDEGQNRQIRRMFEAIGKNIVLLRRDKIGALTLSGLSRGEFKKMSELDLMKVFSEYK